MPVMATATAVSEGRPPVRSATGRAKGMEADLGASDSSVSRVPPSAQASSSAETIATTQPTSNATPIGRQSWRMRPRCANRGTASATVAGPIMKLSSSTPRR